MLRGQEKASPSQGQAGVTVRLRAREIRGQQLGEGLPLGPGSLHRRKMKGLPCWLCAWRAEETCLESGQHPRLASPGPINLPPLAFINNRHGNGLPGRLDPTPTSPKNVAVGDQAVLGLVGDEDSAQVWGLSVCQKNVLPLERISNL